MNFYFFLDGFNQLESSVNLFNEPSSRNLTKDVSKKRKIIAFYSDGEKWIYYNLGVIDKFHNKEVFKNDLPEHFSKESVFIFLCDLDYNFENILTNDTKFMNTMPEWRANIRIFNNNTSCSYQGEYPGIFIDKSLSLVSCTPMIQKSNKINNYLFLVNLNESPKKINFDIEILDSKKNLLGKCKMYTNQINLIDLNTYTKNSNDIVYIIRSKAKGGVPIYFSHNHDFTQMSLEHTHPPSSYLLFGNTMKFQKSKKNYWFN